MERGLLVSVALLFIIPCVTARCKKVYDTSIHCLTGNDLIQLSCPQGHQIVIKDVQYFITSQATCPQHHEDGACSLGALTSSFQRKCYKSGATCEVKVTKKLDSSAGIICSNDIGVHYIGVDYHCESTSSTEINSISLCETRTWSGSKLHITSHLDHAQTTIKNSRCHCKITTHKDLEVQFRRVKFDISPFSEKLCSQSMLVSGGDDLVQVCQEDWTSQDADVKSSCLKDADEVLVEYDTQDESYEVAFVVEALVHNDETFTVQCGLLPSASSTASASPSTGEDDGESGGQTTVVPIPDPQSQSDDGVANKFPVIIGCCIGALILLILAIVILVTRNRRGKAGEDHTSIESETDSNYAFVKDVYLDGTTSSRQVLSKDGKTLPGSVGRIGPAPHTLPPHVA